MEYLLANLGIVSFLILAWGWDLPDEFLARKLLRPLRPLILFLGQWHTWAMFAPDPMRVNLRLQAIIWLSNGESQLWQPESESACCPWRAFLLVRERKWLNNLFGGKSEFLKPALCEILVKRFRAQGHDPARIELVQYRQLVADLGQPAEEEIRKIVYSYQVAGKGNQHSSQKQPERIPAILPGDSATRSESAAVVS